MTRELTKIIADIKAGKGVRVALVYGDDLQSMETCRAIVDALIPVSDRGFNLERFDGRSTPWERIEAALLTPPFIPGKKIVWVENAPYFFNREQKGELAERVLELWRDGKRDDAAKALMEVLRSESWTQQRWEDLHAGNTADIPELLDAASGAARTDAESVIGHARERGMELGGRAGLEGNRLGELLDRGLPEWDFLLLAPSEVDRRTRLFKRLEEAGAVLFLGLERDKTGKVSRESLAEFISGRIQQAGKTLDPQAREMILGGAGDDLRMLSQELEKLVLFAGDRAVITAQDVQEIFLDQSEGWIFDLTRAIGERNPSAALSQLARLTAKGDHPLKLLGSIAGEIRRLIAARQLIDGELRGIWRRGMSYQQFQQRLGSRGALLTRSAWGDYQCLQRAEQFPLNALLAHMENIFAADLRLKSSGVQARLVMEQLLLTMCLGKGRTVRMGLPRANL